MSIFERLRATWVGALAGLTAYVGWLVARPSSRMSEPDAWFMSGPVKWFVLGGAFIGLVGGLAFVESWLERERGEIFESTVINALFVLSLVATACLVFYSLSHGAN